ncbi:MAG: hydrogenase formation protein HypD [Candidatus Goldiibacteriota bacterium]
MPPRKRTDTTENKIVKLIHDSSVHLKKKINIMEVCGTHTMDICRYGIRPLLPDKIDLISGPGCPVCVTPVDEIDAAVEIAAMPDVITATFGDMMKVPGTRSSLVKEKAKGADIRVVYSPAESLRFAAENPDKNIVFIGAGFETTTPAVALTVMEAEKQKIKNFFVLPFFKVIIPPMEALLSDEKVKIDGFLAPGHVSAVIGSRPYEYITEKFHIPCVVTGFEAADILQGILMITKQVLEGRGSVEIQYKRIVKPQGNHFAASAIDKVFETCGTNWRGIGKIPGSGLAFKSGYKKFDAVSRYKPDISYSKEPAGCRCGDVLKGIIKPDKCRLFGRRCVPDNPVGACMVSSEGACAAYYKYAS